MAQLLDPKKTVVITEITIDDHPEQDGLAEPVSVTAIPMAQEIFLPDIFANVVLALEEHFSFYEIVNQLDAIVIEKTLHEYIPILLKLLEKSFHRVVIGNDSTTIALESLPLAGIRSESDILMVTEHGVKSLYHRICEYEPMFENRVGVSFESVKRAFVRELKNAIK